MGRGTSFPSFIVANELKIIKEKLKKWNRDVFGDIKTQKHNLMGVIYSLDVKEGSVGLNSDEIHLGYSYFEGRNLLETKVKGFMA